MRWRASVVASRQRSSAEWAYARGWRHAEGASAQPPSWWGLCAALSTHYLQGGRLVPAAALWPELLPFLLMPNDLLAMMALEEYLVYKSGRGTSDMAWLFAEVNAALSGVDAYDERLVPLLESPERMTDAGWMAFLNYETIRRVRRAVMLYDGCSPHPARPSFWVGIPADE